MDLVIANATVVTEQSARPMHVGVADGRIVALMEAGQPVPQAARVVDATGLILLPGAVDAHTHFTAGHDDIETEVAAGTRGAAKAGVTTVIEMPHANPPATTLAAFAAKQAVFATHSLVDFALWGGIDGANLRELTKMHEAGAVAMKGFMCSGRADGKAGDARALPMLDDDDLVEAMKVIASFDGLIGLHAENHFIIQKRMAALKAAGRADGHAHAAAQPEIAETEAVMRAMFLARETGCRLHIVHLSNPDAAAEIEIARHVQPVTVETCPQYLILDEDDLQRVGAKARCGPPIRPRATVERLWECVLAGEFDALTSDHCPYPMALKADGPIWDAAMGLTGIETTTGLFFSEGLRRGLPLTEFARMTATGPAEVFGLYGQKGAIALGFDADLVLVDPEAEWTVDETRFEGDAKWSPFHGMTLKGVVRETFVRGRSVFADGTPAAPGGGDFVPRRT